MMRVLLYMMTLVGRFFSWRTEPDYSVLRVPETPAKKRKIVTPRIMPQAQAWSLAFRAARTRGATVDEACDEANRVSSSSVSGEA